MAEAPHRPSLRITGMHIERLKAIESLTLPEDGLGWAGEIPPVVMVGGMNGAGKTTLFEAIVRALHCLENDRNMPRMADGQLWIDFEFEGPDEKTLALRFVHGSSSFLKGRLTADCYGYVVDESRRTPFERGDAVEVLRNGLSRARAEISGVVFLPSDERDLTLPEESYKAPGKLPERVDFVYRWQPPRVWKNSLEALLYSLRWEDLNAKEEGRASSSAFESYAEEYRLLTGGANRLRWRDSMLVVETSDGHHHSLEELSSGERQILLLLAELRRHWRPGSLVLIDEPELHLHDVLQARLYDRLLALQRERGGQVWLATQSGYLFEVAEPNTRVILRRKSAE